MSRLLRGIGSLAFGLVLAGSAWVSGERAIAQAELPEPSAGEGDYQEFWPVAAENGAAFGGLGGWVEVEWGSVNGCGLDPAAFPAWWKSCAALGGACEPGLGWRVDAAEPAGAGRLGFEVDRSAWVGGFVLEVTYWDVAGLTLFLGLLDANAAIVDLTDNLAEGSGRIRTAWFSVPWAAYEDVDSIFLLRGVGPLLVSRTVLLADADLDGVPDAYELAWFGTLDYDAGAVTPPGDGPGVPVVEPGLGGGTGPAVPTGPAGSAADLQWLFPRLESRMSGDEFIVTRSAVDGGGCRQTSTNWVLEDSIGQASAIGFMTGELFTLHAGYQQAEGGGPITIWNASVTPRPSQGNQRRFNPDYGEWATFSYVLSAPARSVTLEVVDGVGATVRTLLAGQSQAGGLQALQWNGRDNGGNLLNGAYSFRLQVVSYDGIVTTLDISNAPDPARIMIHIQQNRPVIVSAMAAPEFWPPSEVNPLDYVTAHGQPLDVTLAFENAAGAQVRTFTRPNEPASAYTQPWDGQGTAGNLVPDGYYVCRVNAARGGQNANERTVATIVRDLNTSAATGPDGVASLYYSGASMCAIDYGTSGPGADHAYVLAHDNLYLQSRIYEIQAVPPATFVPPAILIFAYDPALEGDIEDKLQIRRYNPATETWDLVGRQFLDYEHHRVIAEVTSLSWYALMAVRDTGEAGSPGMRVDVEIKPETLNVNPGILTAHIRFPAGYEDAVIDSATCDGAEVDRIEGWILTFRRQAVEAALAAAGEVLDTHFVVQGTFRHAGGVFRFQGEDDIMKIVDK